MDESLKNVVETANKTLRLLAETFQGELEMNYNSMSELGYLMKEPFLVC